MNRAELQPDRAQIEQFFKITLKHADDGTFVSLRSFEHGAGTRPFAIKAVQVNGNLGQLVDTAVGMARAAAKARQSVVFAPPVATFSNPEHAAEADLANGTVLSVECDQRPRDGRQTLEGLLDPATVVVASGGEWTSPDTGEVEDKLHLHWVLNEPTRTPEEHAKLKLARKLATLLIGGDPTAVPAVHPLRLPGSWHRKGKPKLCRIIATHEDAELDLDEALNRLEAAAHAAGLSLEKVKANPDGEDRDTALLIRLITTGTEYLAPLVALSARYAGRGMSAKQIEQTLRGFMDAVPDAVRDIKDGKPQPGRWADRVANLGRMARSAVAKYGLKAEAPPKGKPNGETRPGSAEEPVAKAPEREADAAADDWRSQLAAAVDELNAKHFVVPLGGRTVICTFVREDILQRERLVFSGSRDIELRYASRHYMTGFNKLGEPMIRELGRIWLRHERRRSYERMVFLPKGETPEGCFNLWRGFGLEPKRGPWGTIRQHLLDIICDGSAENLTYLLYWFAYAIQYPERPTEVAVVMRGPKGCGKGMVGRLFMRLFRNHSLHITNPRHLVGNFNSHLVNCLAIFIDEAFLAGDKNAEGVLKGIITEPSLMIEPKGLEPFPVANMLKPLISSNHDWVIPVTADERRFFSLDVSEARVGNRNYFARLNAAIEGDEAGAFLQYLLDLDLANFDIRDVPHTTALNRQKLLSFEDLEVFWLDCLLEGTIPGTARTTWPEAIAGQVLHGAYLDHARNRGARHLLSQEGMGRRLRRLWAGCTFRRDRLPATEADPSRPKGYFLDDLKAHRAAFLKAANITATDAGWGEESADDPA